MDTQEYISGLKSFKSFTEDIKNNRLFHSIMLINNDGDFLRAYSKLLAASILCCDGNNDESTNIKVQKEIHPDVLLFGRDRPIDAEDAREIVSSSLVAPYEGNRKVYIIDRFDEMQPSSANKLLKTIEEPPSGVVFILLVKNESRVLQTLKSRSQKFYIEGYSSAVVSGVLKGLGYSDCELIAMQSGNNLENAKNLASGGNSRELSKFVIDTFMNLKKTTDLIRYTSRAELFKDELKDMFSFFANVAENSMRKKAGLELANNSGIETQLNKIVEEWSYMALIGVVDASVQALKMLDSYVQVSNCVDCFFLKVLEVRRKCKQ